MSIHTRYRHIYTYSIDSEALDCWQQLIAVFYVLLESEVFLEFLSITLLRPPFLLLPYTVLYTSLLSFSQQQQQ